RWVAEYPYVHDDYPAIAESYAAILSAMKSLGIEDEAAKGYIGELSVRVSTLIEKMGGSYEPERKEFDFAELEKALNSFEKAFIAQYYDSGVASKVRDSIFKQIKEMLEIKPVEPLTTWDMNEKIKEHITNIVVALVKKKASMDAAIAELLERQSYLEQLAEMDGEISYDSQIAMAEDAIAKQLRICPASRGNLAANAVLGFASVVLGGMFLNDFCHFGFHLSIVFGHVAAIDSSQILVFNFFCHNLELSVISSQLSVFSF
ncbi:MAG: hypothetical protein IIT60_00130, partial [Muribaculaceae bacterium]|nr:hypothetical protein [Muribaculaceae bacterium]